MLRSSTVQILTYKILLRLLFKASQKTSQRVLDDKLVLQRVQRYKTTKCVQHEINENRQPSNPLPCFGRASEPMIIGLTVQRIVSNLDAAPRSFLVKFYIGELKKEDMLKESMHKKLLIKQNNTKRDLSCTIQVDNLTNFLPLIPSSVGAAQTLSGELWMKHRRPVHLHKL